MFNSLGKDHVDILKNCERHHLCRSYSPGDARLLGPFDESKHGTKDAEDDEEMHVSQAMT